MSENAKRPWRLLIAEDCNGSGSPLHALLRGQSGFCIATAANGSEALENFRSNPPDVVLCDMRLPDLTGPELLRLVRDVDPGAKFILMSPLEEADDAINAVRSGALDFIHKPPDLPSVLASVNRAFLCIEEVRLQQSVVLYRSEEHTTFQIPNRIELLPHVVFELTRGLDRDPHFGPLELEGIRASLHEAILNAIEHGNLGIDYEEKGALIVSPKAWRKEIERRAHDPALIDRMVRIQYHNTPDSVSFTVSDEGEGFNLDDVPDPTKNVQSLHGRGILITRIHMDEVAYNDAGNEVTLVKRKRPDASAPDPLR